MSKRYLTQQDNYYPQAPPENPFLTPEETYSASSLESHQKRYSSEFGLDVRLNIFENREGSVSTNLLASPYHGSRNSSSMLVGNPQDKHASVLSDPFLSENYREDESPFGGYPIAVFPLTIDEKEEDDSPHYPDPLADALYDKNTFNHYLILIV